jgi:hypothetical protein
VESSACNNIHYPHFSQKGIIRFQARTIFYGH